MLLKFSVDNYRSISAPQTISLIAADPYLPSDHHLLGWPSKKAASVLPTAVIFGANASGKSNLIEAFELVQLLIMQSHSLSGQAPLRTPFRLDPAKLKAPSVFVVDFVIDGVRYTYGFSLLDRVVLKEWLHYYPRGHRRILFNRARRRITPSADLGGRKKVIADLTRSDSLYLSAGAQNGHQVLTKIHDYFATWIADKPSFNAEPTISEHVAQHDLGRIIQILGDLDTGIVSFRKRRRKLGEKAQEFTRELDALFQTRFSSWKSIDLRDVPEIQLGHRGALKEPTYFDLGDESAGTQRLLPLLARALNALEKGSLLLVDELDANLHTVACKMLVDLFRNEKINKKGAQIIATTHDTNLLSMLAKEEVWFTEKQRTGGTYVYSLSDYRTKVGDPFEAGYLEGRYGAIPRPRLRVL